LGHLGFEIKKATFLRLLYKTATNYAKVFAVTHAVVTETNIYLHQLKSTDVEDIAWYLGIHWRLAILFHWRYVLHNSVCIN